MKSFFIVGLAIGVLLTVLSGCEMTRSLEEMPQDLEDVAVLKTSMDQVAALKEPMEQVAVLKSPMEQVAALKEPMEQVAALKAPMEQVAVLKEPMGQVAELKEPMVALGPLAKITQPGTYVPMFGFVGFVLFLAIWGGIKMGRR